jgi:hypothetical protein
MKLSIRITILQKPHTKVISETYLNTKQSNNNHMKNFEIGTRFLNFESNFASNERRNLSS